MEYKELSGDLLRNFTPCNECESSTDISLVISSPYKYCRITGAFNPDAEYCYHQRRTTKNKILLKELQDYLPE